MDPKSIKKALGFSLKVDAVSPLRENAKFQWRYGVLAHAEKLLKIPYKTCRKWMILSPFCKMASKSIKKALGFSLKRECGSAMSQNLIKPAELSSFTPPLGRTCRMGK